MEVREQAQQSFGAWLRQHRRALDLTQEELARQVGCSAITLRKLEAEERRPSKQIAERLADILQVPPDDRPAFLRFARGDPFAGPADAKIPDKPEAKKSPTHNLPLQLTSFVGREKAIAEVKRLLTPSPGPSPSPERRERSGEGEGWSDSAWVGVRLLTLTGTGGTGKTRLAQQVAAGLLDAFPDGVWLVELAPLANPALVPQAVANALGLREMSGLPITAVLLDHLRRRRHLLLLDNCEHLVQACAELAETLLRACPHVTILATSREGLGIAGESVYPVSSLSLPAASPRDSIDALNRSEAARLFVERASAVLPGFALTNDNAPAVAEICRQLDGIPLAIELAAARVRVLRVEQIVARLDDRFRLLTGGSRTALQRHQTLQGLIDWSYDLLSESERVLLQRLAVFMGGWTLEAAEAVGAGEGVQASEVLDLLTQLVNKSLVLAERQPGTKARYRLLETIRQYALARLAATGQADAVWRRLTAYYIELANTPKSTEPMPADRDRMRRLLPERDNLRAALTWSQSATGSAELGLRLAGAIVDLWIGPGYWNEARRLLEDALAHAEGTDHTLARARVLWGLGHVAALLGDHAIAQTHLVHSLTLSQELQDQPMIGWTLSRLSDLAGEQGDTVTARLRAEESLALFRELGSTEGIAAGLSSLGEIAVMQEDDARAIPLFEEALALYRSLDLPWYVGWALISLGRAAQTQGDFERARRLHEDSLVQFREFGGANFAVPCALHGLGETALAQDDAPLASTHFTQALAMFHDMGDRKNVAWCLAGVAGVAVLNEEPERAARLWGAAEALRQAIGGRQAPATRATRERLMAAAREQLGEAAFAEAWAVGQAMTMEQAIAEALAAP